MPSSLRRRVPLVILPETHSAGELRFRRVFLGWFLLDESVAAEDQALNRRRRRRGCRPPEHGAARCAAKLGVNRDRLEGIISR